MAIGFWKRLRGYHELAAGAPAVDFGEVKLLGSGRDGLEGAGGSGSHHVSVYVCPGRQVAGGQAHFFVVHLDVIEIPPPPAAGRKVIPGVVLGGDVLRAGLQRLVNGFQAGGQRIIHHDVMQVIRRYHGQLGVKQFALLSLGDRCAAIIRAEVAARDGDALVQRLDLVYRQVDIQMGGIVQIAGPIIAGEGQAAISSDRLVCRIIFLIPASCPC